MKEILKSDECVLLNAQVDCEYITNCKIEEGYVLLTEKEKVCFVDARYYFGIEKLLIKNKIKPCLLTTLDDIKNYLAQKKITKLRVNYKTTTVYQFEEYKKFNLELQDGSGYIESLRSVKTKDELKNIKRACEIVQKAYYKTLRKLRRGVTELQVKDFIEKKMKKLGADGIAFPTIVAFGSNSAVPHHVSGKEKLKRNSVVLIDVGCKVKGYCSDLTRTVYYGKPPLKFYMDYDKVLNANLKCIEEITSTFTGRVADNVARDYLKSVGVDKEFSHSLGHGVGREIHEAPYLSQKSNEILEDGTVFTIEPGAYFNDKYGIRIEDTVYMKKGKIERLFTDDKKLLMI